MFEWGRVDHALAGRKEFADSHRVSNREPEANARAPIIPVWRASPLCIRIVGPYTLCVAKMATHLGSPSRTASTAASPTYSSPANTTDTNSDEDSDDSGALVDYDVRAPIHPPIAATALLPCTVCTNSHK